MTPWLKYLYLYLLLSHLFAIHQSTLPGVDGNLGAVCKVQFAQDVADVTLDRVLADHQLFRDLAVGQEAVLTVLAREDAKLGLIFLDMGRAVTDLAKLV